MDAAERRGRSQRAREAPRRSSMPRNSNAAAADHSGRHHLGDNKSSVYCRPSGRSGRPHKEGGCSCVTSARFVQTMNETSLGTHNQQRFFWHSFLLQESTSYTYAPWSFYGSGHGLWAFRFDRVSETSFAAVHFSLHLRRGESARAIAAEY